ncbi:MAG TPA: SMP-30/gluconolactonase/LRE family protein, partial [Tepidisphaeraceae bacterium]|nr:SMP-30/gluconolactonase/LRE family protein [Tepidisphaeraceae bacterium]
MGTHFARIVAGGVIGMLVAGCAVKKADDGPAVQKAAGEFMPMPAFGTLPAGKIERLDPALDVLIPPGAQVEMLVSGLDWCEGPTWVKAGPLTKTPGLLFCDIPQNTVYKLDPNTRQIEVFVKPSGYTSLEARGGEVGSNGIVVGPDGKLVLCQHGDRRVAQWAGHQFITIAESFEGKRFNS